MRVPILWLLTIASLLLPGALCGAAGKDCQIGLCVSPDIVQTLGDDARRVAKTLEASAPAVRSNAELGNAEDVLSLVLARISTAVKQRRTPVVIFDIDDTLLRTDRPRYLSLQDAAQTPELMARYPREVQAIRELTWERAEWTFELAELLNRAGAIAPGFLEVIKPFWQQAFACGRHAPTLLPIEGAAAYVRAVHETGATIVFLTARDASRYATATRASLASNGFPIDSERVHTIFKQDVAVPDLDHKKKAMEEIALLGDIVASFEDELPNLNAFVERFPQVTGVLLTARPRHWSIKPYPGITRVSRYLR